VARVKFAALFEAAESDFETMVWDIRKLKHRSGTTLNSHLHFSLRGRLDSPLPSLFADVIKSWLVLEYRSSVGTMANRLATMRVLWEAIVARRQGQQMAFSWEGLCEEDLSQAELFARSYYGPSAAYKRAKDLTAFARFLMARRLCRPLYYTPQIPYIEA
jgi:hypothetical protein